MLIVCACGGSTCKLIPTYWSVLAVYELPAPCLRLPFVRLQYPIDGQMSHPARRLLPPAPSRQCSRDFRLFHLFPRRLQACACSAYPSILQRLIWECLWALCRRCLPSEEALDGSSAPRLHFARSRGSVSFAHSNWTDAPTVFALVRTATSEDGKFTKQLLSDCSSATSAWAAAFFGAISGDVWRREVTLLLFAIGLLGRSWSMSGCQCRPESKPRCGEVDPRLSPLDTHHSFCGITSVCCNTSSCSR
jgi:hypothetical protein